MLRIYTQKIDGKPLRFDNHSQRLYDDFDRKCADGCYEVTIKKAVKPKTKKQLGAHFGLLIATAIAEANRQGIDTSGFLKELIRTDKTSGVGLTKEFLKHVLYITCPIFRDGKPITLREANTAEASKHFEDCRNLLASHGIYVPEPNPDWRKA
jgi:hypothetical protein